MASRFDVGKLREALGMTQERFAALVHVHLRTVRRWEMHEVDPSPMAIAHMKALAHDHREATATHDAPSEMTP